MTWNDFETEVESNTRGNGVRCALCRLLESLDEDANKKLGDALNRPELSSAAIVRTLESKVSGKLPSVWTVNRHRRGECQDRRAR